MRSFVLKSAAVLGLTVLLFALMQFFFGAAHSFDMGARYGFPFSYMQDGTYATAGHVLWLGFAGDVAIAVVVSGLAVWGWRRRNASK